MRKNALLFGLLLTALPFTAFARDQTWERILADLRTQCLPWEKVPVPQADVGSAPKDCKSEELYYGSDGKTSGTDHAAARQCAYRERKHLDTDNTPNGHHSDSLLGASGILMMLYANGQGVARNIPLAKRFACEYEGAPAELESRLKHLDAIAHGLDNKPFDICDDITSGMMGGVCADRDAGFERFARENRWTSLQATWTPAQRDSLAKLRGSAEKYFDISAGRETDQSGTARGAFVTEAHETLDKSLLDNIERLEREHQPPATAADFATADTALNAMYKQVLAKLDAAHRQGQSWGDYGTIDSNGVRETQRSWLAYREAWATFGTARYPGIPANAWRAWVTQERTQALNCLVNGRDKTCPHDDH